MSRRSILLMGACLGSLSAHGCAGAGSTVGSGVPDRLFEAPPYYAGRTVAGRELRIVHLPVAYQRGGTQPAFLEPRGGEGSAVAGLVADMNAYLEALSASAPLRLEAPLPGTPPDVRFGCDPRPVDECDREERVTGVPGRVRMRLAVGRPSAEWVDALGRALDAAEADAALVLTLEIGEYWVHQRDRLGRKEVRLGTDRMEGVPWLTSLDQPVQVLQLTGALVGRDGRAIRIGAEGLLARRTPLLLSGFDVQALISDEDAARLREPAASRSAGRGGGGAPRPVWQEAMDAMVRELAGGAGERR